MSCPGDAALAQLHSADSTRDPALAAHVDGCAACRQRLDSLGAGDHTFTSSARTEEVRVGNLEPGAHFDRYTLLERVGTGGMGEVYSAWDPRLDRRVALKVLRADGAVDDEARQRLVREAQALARLSHPSVVAVHDVGVAGEEVYVAMEFVDGRTLTRWLKEAPRTEAEILEVFRHAGEGLAAAHAAGLVHRDFKPANVLIGHDGRVRVADFGLARAPGDHDPSPPPSSETTDPGLAGHARLPTLTRLDTIVGTPGYMPPEQLEGLPPDPRADQYSFCAALHEALAGRRPFKGDTLLALGQAMQAGLPEEPPEGTRILPRLYRVLRRGLAPAAEARFADMRALLAALAQDPSVARRRRLGTAAVATALVVSLGALVVAARQGEQDVCAEARATPALFGDARKGELDRAFASTGKRYAGHVAGSAERALSDWSDAYVQVRTGSCEAARVRGELPEATYAVRAACLALAAEQARSLVALLLTADEGTVRNALGAIGRLPHPTACLDPRALSALEALPADPASRAQVEGLRIRLAGLHALNEAGRHAEAEAQLSALLPDAEAARHLPLVAQTLFARGLARVQQSRYPEATADLHRAAQLGLEGGDEVTAARAFMELALLAARVHGRHEDGQLWLAYAGSALTRGGSPSREAVELEHLAGSLRYLQADYAEALVHFDAALRLQERALPADVPLRIRILDDGGWVLSWLGRHEEGFARYEEAMALGGRVFGDDHPEMARLFDRAGSVLEELDELERAVDLQTRALAIREAALGPDAELVGTSLNHLALVLVRMGRAPEGVAAASRALDIFVQRLGPAHVRVASVQHTLGMMHEEAGDHAQALRRYAESLEGYARLRGADSTSTAFSLHGLGSANLRAGAPERALPHLRRAWEIRERAELLPYERGLTRLALAQALWLTGRERDRVPALLEGARADLRAAGRKGAPKLAELEAWALQQRVR